MEPFIVCLNKERSSPGKVLHKVLMLNDRENIQHLDKECVQKSKTGSWAVRQRCLSSGPLISVVRKALGLEPRLDVAEHLKIVCPS